jgi:hypothetical protein
LPLVFSHFRGTETFAAKFVLVIQTPSGKKYRRKITPAVYSLLRGPYNRRNVYGAAIAYGPMLDRGSEAKMVRSVLEYGLCSKGPLHVELKIPTVVKRFKMKVVTKTRGNKKVREMRVQCHH